MTEEGSESKHAMFIKYLRIKYTETKDIPWLESHGFTEIANKYDMTLRWRYGRGCNHIVVHPPNESDAWVCRIIIDDSYTYDADGYGGSAREAVTKARSRLERMFENHVARMFPPMTEKDGETR